MWLSNGGIGSDHCRKGWDKGLQEEGEKFPTQQQRHVRSLQGSCEVTDCGSGNCENCRNRLLRNFSVHERITVCRSLSSAQWVHTWVLQTNISPEILCFPSPRVCWYFWLKKWLRDHVSGCSLFWKIQNVLECYIFVPLQSYCRVRALERPSCFNVTPICLTSFPFLSFPLVLRNAYDQLHLDFTCLQHPQAFPGESSFVCNWRIGNLNKLWCSLRQDTGYSMVMVLAVCGNPPPQLLACLNASWPWCYLQMDLNSSQW